MLNPQTATIKSLPTNSSLYLPKVGSAETMSEEETRESLRRFINEWQGLIGADPAQLSLLEHLKQSDGFYIARYEQHPFRFPLRGGYGVLGIKFSTDRRVIDFTSTCIPNSDRIQPAIATMSPQLGWEEAVKRIVGLTVSYQTGTAQSNSYQITQANQPNAGQLVIYVLEPTSGSPLTFRLAWEIAVDNAPFKFVYLDAVDGSLLTTA
jgi:hypothetical protein